MAMDAKAWVWEYAESEAGRALAEKRFTTVSEGGVVVYRREEVGVMFDVLDAGTGMAPRLLTDGVSVHIYRKGVDAEDALALAFEHLSAFIATLA